MNLQNIFSVCKIDEKPHEATSGIYGGNRKKNNETFHDYNSLLAWVRDNNCHFTIIKILFLNNLSISLRMETLICQYKNIYHTVFKISKIFRERERKVNQ